MNVSRIKDNRGFSLIEMVMVMTIMAVIGGVGARMMGTGFSSYYASRDIVPLLTKGQVGMERLIRELRSATCAGITEPSARTISFTNEFGSTVTVAQATGATSITMNGKLLVEDIQANSLSFTVDTSYCVVQISFWARRELSTAGDGSAIRIPFQTAVYVRN